MSTLSTPASSAAPIADGGVPPRTAVFFAALAVGLTLAVFTFGESSPRLFIPPPATVILLLLAFFVGSSIIGTTAIRAALSTGASPASASPEQLRAALADLRVIDVILIASGGTMVLIGLIATLQCASVPSTIGPAVSFALQTSVFTILFSRLGIFPLILRVRRAFDWPPPAGQERLLANLVWIILPVANLIGFLLVLHI